MKLKLLFYIAAFLTATCFTTQAMEDSSKLSPEALEELNTIVCTGFTLPLYNHNDLLKVSEKLPGTQHNMGSFVVVTENPIIVQIMSYLPPKGLLNLGETCTFLHALGLSPCFYLNEYCLQPGILRSIPVSVIRWKTERTKDGILKLAGSYDGTPKNLCQWFEKQELVKVQETFGPFPETVEGLDEKGLERLYSVRQVNAAVAFPNPLQLSTNFHQSVSMIPHTSPLFPHCIRFMGYTPQGAYPAQDLCKSVNQMRSGEIPFNFDLIEVFGHDTAINVNSIWNLSTYFNVHPQKSTIAIQVLKWCSKYEVGLISGSSLVWQALEFNQPELAIEIARKVLKLDDSTPQSPFANKASVVAALADKAEFKDDLEAFTKHALEYWRGDHWELPGNGHINGYTKKLILRLMLRTGLTENFDDIYANLENPLQETDPDDELIEDLFTYGKSELGIDIIRKNMSSAYPIQRIYLVVPFVQRLVSIDHVNLVPCFKNKMAEHFAKHGEVFDTQIEILLGLASSSKEPENKSYVASNADFMAKKLESQKHADDKLYLKLAMTYFLIENTASSISYYFEWVNRLLVRHPKFQEYHLSRLKEYGLPLTELKDLESMSPNEVFSKIWQSESDRHYHGYMFCWY